MAKKKLISGLAAYRLGIPMKCIHAPFVNCDAGWVDARRLKRAKRKCRK